MTGDKYQWPKLYTARGYFKCNKIQFVSSRPPAVPLRLAVLLSSPSVGAYLQQQPLVRPDGGAAPVDALVEGQSPAVAQQHGHAARRQRLQEPVRAQAPPARHQTERRIC